MYEMTETEIETDGMTLNQALGRMARIQAKGRGVCGLGATRGKHVIHVQGMEV